MSSLPRLLLVAIVAAFALSGCKTVQNAYYSGLPQTVTIDSVPSNADVYVNGEYLGTTPTTTKLPRKITHEVRLEKDGYVVQRQFFSPQPNDSSRNYIRFGLLEDFGMYVDLTPNDMISQMRHSLIPVVATNEPFKEMAYRVMLADALLDSGAISSDEHSVIYNELVSFYSTN